MAYTREKFAKKLLDSENGICCLIVDNMNKQLANVCLAKLCIHGRCRVCIYRVAQKSMPL